jgi:hypothetical protein
MDILELYQDFSVDFKTEGHKHCRPGWVNTECPFCEGNFGYHLGYNIQANFYACWRCGWHPISLTIAKLLKISEKEAYTIIKQYGILIPKLQPIKVSTRVKEHRLPSESGPLEIAHVRYLQGRGFDPDRLIADWHLLATSPISMLDGISYKHRILIPFFWDQQQVSFDSRDITGKHPAKYLACPKDRELIPHKDILYGRQDKWTDTGICVEGPTDVWRFGFNSFATSGIKYTPAQVRIIAKTFKRVPVVYDDDPQAIVQAKLLVAELKFRGVDSFRVPIEGDPGSMRQDEADYFVTQLIIK